MNVTNISHFTIALDKSAHRSAGNFAAKQTSPTKGRRVYLNTLAVSAVRQYLNCVCDLDIDLTHGYSWNPEVHSIMNVADLVIPNLGRIECVRVLPDVYEVILTPEIIDDRIGYVAVQFSEDLTSVELLGFVVKPEGGIININQLQPLEDLLDLIYVDSAEPTLCERINNLSQFLNGILGIGWEPIESLIVVGGASPLENRNITIPNQPDFALRNILTSTPYESIREFNTGKIIDLRAHIANIPLLLLIGLNHEPDGRINVRARLHSTGGVPVLPPNLKLTLQDANGESLSQVQYPEAMNFIQLQSFKLKSGTQFKIQVALDNHSFTELFIA
jgi:Protein of unknown function (DUF1822)